MIATGIFNIYVGFKWFNIKDNVQLSSILSVISFIITVLAIYLLKRTHNPKLLVLFLVILILLCNILKIFYDPNFLVQNKLFIVEKGVPFDFKASFTKALEGNIDLFLILKNFGYIFAIATSPILSFSASITYYTKLFNLNIDYNNELKAFSISSLASAITCFPTHISSSGSTLFKMCSASNKYHSILAGVFLILLIPIYQYITPFLPVFALSFLSLFIGFSILIGYIKLIREVTLLDKIILIFLTLVALLSGMNSVIVVITGILVNFLISLYYIKGIPTEKSLKVQELDEVLIIKVKDGISHMNIQSITEKMYEYNKNIVFDLLDSKYVDYTSNIELNKAIENCEKRGVNVQILGKPANLNITTQISK